MNAAAATGHGHTHGHSSHGHGGAPAPSVCLNVACLKEAAKQSLNELLATIPGKKSLILDNAVNNAITLIADKAALKDQHTVEKWYVLKSSVHDYDCKNLLFVIRARVHNVRIIATQIKELMRQKANKEYHIIFVPRRTVVCERVLEDEDLIDHVSIKEFPLLLVPYDEDVLTMEAPEAFRECYLEGNSSICFDIARCICRLQELYGVIPIIRGKGEYSQKVVEILKRMKRESGDEVPIIESEIDSLVIVDRNVDMITPLLTQLTFEGLLDEHYGIHNGVVQIDEEIVPVDMRPKRAKEESKQAAKVADVAGPVASAAAAVSPDGDKKGKGGKEEKKKKMKNPLKKKGKDKEKGKGKDAEEEKKTTDITQQIVQKMDASTREKPVIKEKRWYSLACTSNEKLFAQLRDNNFASAGQIMKRRTEFIQSVEDEKKTLGDKSLSQVKDYVRRLRELNLGHEKSTLALFADLGKDMMRCTKDPFFSKRLEAEQCILQNKAAIVWEYLEDQIFREMPLKKILRLLCLESLTSAGLRKFDSFRSHIVNTYGYSNLFMLLNLETLGMFVRQQGSTDWNEKIKRYNLMRDDVSEITPSDLHFIYSGYCPLLARIAQSATKPPPPTQGGWPGMQNHFQLLPGPLFEMRQTPPVDMKPKQEDERKMSIVVFIGGCTFSEISAMRWLGNNEGGAGRDIIVMTTNIMNGDSFLDPLFEDLIPTKNLK